MSAVGQRPRGRALRLNVGITDSISKLMGFKFLKPAIGYPEPTHIVCRTAAIEPLITQLQAHRLDIVLADEPASSTLKAKTYSHRLGRSGVAFCAVPSLAKKLRRNFPRSLNGAPALLPTENMGRRSVLETWFSDHDIRPRLIGEYEDSALMAFALPLDVVSPSCPWLSPAPSSNTGVKGDRQGRGLRDRVLCHHRRTSSQTSRRHGDYAARVFRNVWLIRFGQSRGARGRTRLSLSRCICERRRNSSNTILELRSKSLLSTCSSSDARTRS